MKQSCIYAEENMTYQEYKTEYDISLDPDQDKACEKTGGHILLLAVPGSGKTTVMTAKLGYLVKGLGVPPESILAVTYSVAGAREMQRRYENIFGSREIEIRTINGFCAKIIGTYERIYGRHAFSLLESEGETSRILRVIMKDCGGYPSENEVKDVKTAITYCRNMLLTEKEIAEKISIEGRDFPEIFRRYREFKVENKLMDYDDQLCYGYHIMCRFPEVNRAYSGRFRYICVDEAQDTSKIQHMIIRKAAENCGNLFMVGDEDQSIYGFRAAYPEGLLEFEKIYPDAFICFIEKNYRSTQTIVSAADRFISLNAERRDKHMNTDNAVGDNIKRTELTDLRELPTYIKKRALNCAGEKKETTAVLCRLNDSLIPIIDVLCDAGIPFSVRAVDGLFFTHFIVTDMIAMIRFAANPFDAGLFENLYYKFSAGISRTDCEYALTHNVGKEMLSYPEYFSVCPVFPEKVRKRMRKVSDALFRINAADSYGALKLIISASGYGSYLSHRTRDLSKVNTLLAIAERFRSKKDFFERLDFLSDQVKQGHKSDDGMILSTIHSAKGMEFDNVILCDAKNGVLPSVTEPADGKKYTKEEERLREEDRRLFYVAVTRAKKRLELITYRFEFGEKCEGWDFVNTFTGVPPKTAAAAPARTVKKSVSVEKLIKAYSVGENVMHKVFGEGVIIGRRGSFAEIRFYKDKYPRRVDLTVCLENGLICRV